MPLHTKGGGLQKLREGFSLSLWSWVPRARQGLLAGLWGLSLGEGWLTTLYGTTLAAVEAATSCFDERYQNLKVGEEELIYCVHS